MNSVGEIKRYYLLKENENHEGNYDSLYVCKETGNIKTLFALLDEDRCARFPIGTRGIPITFDGKAVGMESLLRDGYIDYILKSRANKKICEFDSIEKAV